MLEAYVTKEIVYPNRVRLEVYASVDPAGFDGIDIYWKDQLIFRTDNMHQAKVFAHRKSLYYGKLKRRPYVLPKNKRPYTNNSYWDLPF